jgi:lincosamide nucleotidyltransferase A/C/D/E
VAERAHFWYRFTNRLNILIWALPVPRRVRAVLSRIVYQNPPMPRSDVLRILRELDAAGVEPVLMGGWGIDALVGEEQRLHRDLDLILDCGDLDKALSRLRELGFEEWFRNPDPVPFVEHGIEGDVIVMRDAAMRVVDLHPMRLDDSGPTPADGTIGDRRVACISAKLQVKAHTGNRIRSRREKRRHEANLETARRALATADRTGRRNSSGSRALAQ